MDFDLRTAIAAALLFAWFCPPLTRSFRVEVLRGRLGVPVSALMALDVVAGLLGGLLIAQWWALAIPVVAYSTAALLGAWPSAVDEDEGPESFRHPLLGTLPFVLIIDVAPVACGVAVALNL